MCRVAQQRQAALKQQMGFEFVAFDLIAASAALKKSSDW